MPANIENCAELPLDDRLNAIKLEQENPDEHSSEASTIRQCRPILNNTAAKTNFIDKDGETPKKLLDKFTLSQIFGCLATLLIIVITMRFGQEMFQNESLIFKNIALDQKNYYSLSIRKISDYRVVVRDFSFIMERSDIMIKNGKKISEVLFELDKEIQKAGDELEEFRHQAKSFYFSFASEMSSITQVIEKSQWLKYSLFKYFIKSNSHLLYKRFELLEQQILELQKLLKQVINTTYSVHNSADNTQGYLIDGEREAERALKEHWLGNIVDYTVRVRAEDELLRVRIIIKMLKETSPALLNFEALLKEYHRNQQDVAKVIQNIPIKPTVEDMKYLKKAVVNLEEHHAQFSSAEKQFMSMDTYNDKYLEEKKLLEEQRTKFSSEGYKPMGTYNDVKDTLEGSLKPIFHAIEEIFHTIKEKISKSAFYFDI
ncbi:20016_t:CDS:2 [Gigaspora margarita]|uniref:20016_t:CDS:1 n=1 Tax=Gigaspora margarita TaxID=4874 RepID=A0ABM8W5I9_GIGMA|nr:20016_t:CDS:2 [Gigaspora margarita]